MTFPTRFEPLLSVHLSCSNNASCFQEKDIDVYIKDHLTTPIPIEEKPKKELAGGQFGQVPSESLLDSILHGGCTGGYSKPSSKFSISWTSALKPDSHPHPHPHSPPRWVPDSVPVGTYLTKAQVSCDILMGSQRNVHTTTLCFQHTRWTNLRSMTNLLESSRKSWAFSPQIATSWCAN